MGMLKARVNGKWEPVGFSSTDRWNTAWGLVATSNSSDVAVSAASPGTTVCTVSVPFVAGRQYELRVTQMGSYVTGGAVAANSFSMTMRTDGVDQWTAPIPVPADGNYFTPANVSNMYTGTTITHTVTLAVMRNNGTGVMQARFKVYVYDIGPVGGAVAIPNPTPDWISLPALQNGWEHYSGGSTQYGAGAMRKIGDKVEFRGLLGNQLNQNGTADITVLPIGYRPAVTGIHSCYGVHGGAAGAIRIDVQTDGRVIANFFSSGVTDYLSLANVAFSTTL